MSLSFRTLPAAALLIASQVLATIVSAQPQPGPSQGALEPGWATVRALKQGTELVVLVAGRKPIVCWFVAADESTVVVLELVNEASDWRRRQARSSFQPLWPDIANSRQEVWEFNIDAANQIKGRRLQIAKQEVIALRTAGANYVHFLSPAPSFAELATRLEIGDTVNVTDDTGRVIRGRIAGLTASSLSLRRGGSTREFQAAQVKELSTQRPHHSLILGALAGAGIVFVVLDVLAYTTGAVSNEVVPPALSAAAVVGALVAARPGQPVLAYRAMPGGPNPGVGISPILTPTRHGVAIRWSF